MPKHYPFRLKVEPFAGVSIDDAAEELVALADRTGCMCEMVFNDVTCWARPGDSHAALTAEWWRAVRNAQPNKFAQVRRRDQ